MYAYHKFVCLIFVILLGINAGCAAVPVPVAPELVAGQVEAIQTGTALWVVNEYLDHAASTFALGKEGITFFAAPMQQIKAWGSVVMNVNSKMPLLEWGICGGGTGTAYTYGDMADIVSCLLNHGYKIIKPETLPAAFIHEARAAAPWLAQIPLTILVLPIGASEIPFELLPSAGSKE